MRLNKIQGGSTCIKLLKAHCRVALKFVKNLTETAINIPLKLSV
jgi:hypothetical protein